MKKGLGIGFLAIVLSLSWWVAGEGAQTKEKTSAPAIGFGFSANSKAPIDIVSDGVEGNQKQNMVTFKGNVVAKQEDITLYANMIVVHYDPETKKLKEISAEGNVRIVQLDRRATGQKAIFYQDENKVVLEGDAVLREGENVIRGERVTYYANEERSVVEPGKGGRVNTTIVNKKD